MLKTRSTIRDVASLANVSISTVSRVLNGNYPVREETRARVLAAMRACNYSRSQVARSLATRKTGIIGVVGTEIINPYFAEMLHHIQQVAGEHDYDVLFKSTETAAGEVKAMNLFIDRRVDGIVMIARQEETADCSHIARAAELVPVVLVGMPIDLPNVYSLYADEAKGVRQLAAELIRLGHRGFLFLGGREHSFPAVQRLSGLRRAVAGVPHCRVEVEFSGYSFERSAEALSRRVKKEGLLEWCTAIVCVSDHVAMGGLSVLHEAGMEVPGQVSITGFDDVVCGRSVYPPLTTVNIPKEALARAAVDAVLALAAGSQAVPKADPLPCTVVSRASHGRARAVCMERLEASI